MFGSWMYCTYLIYDLLYNRCKFVSNYETLVLLLFGLLSIYCSTSTVEKIGSLTISVSSLTNWIKSIKLDSLSCLLRIVKTFLNHLSLEVPGNFDSNMHIMPVYPTHSNFEDDQYFQAWPRSSGISDMHQHHQIWFETNIRFLFHRLLWFCKGHHIFQWAIVWQFQIQSQQAAEWNFLLFPLHHLWCT